MSADTTDIPPSFDTTLKVPVSCLKYIVNSTTDISNQFYLLKNNQIYSNNKVIFKSSDYNNLNIQDFFKLPLLDILIISYPNRTILFNFTLNSIIFDLNLHLNSIQFWNNHLLNNINDNDINLNNKYNTNSSLNFDNNNGNSNDNKSDTESISDMISLATSTTALNSELIHNLHVDPNTSFNSINTNNTNTATINDDIISCIAIVSDTQIFIFKWKNTRLIDRYNLYLQNITFIKFLNAMNLLAISKNDDLMHINLKTSQIKHYNDTTNNNSKKGENDNQKRKKNNYNENLTKNLKLSKSIWSWNSQIRNIEIINNKLFILQKNFYSIFSFPQFAKIDELDLIKLKVSYKFSIFYFPFLVLYDDYNLQLRSIINFNLLKSYNFKNKISNVSFSNLLLSIKINNELFVDDFNNLTDFLPILKSQKDYDNAILFINNSTLNNLQKFYKLREFKLLKAFNLIDTHFKFSMNVFTQYLAIPNEVIQKLPINIHKLLFKYLDISSEIQEIPKIDDQLFEKIRSLIGFLVDARRKLLKLINNSFSFTYNNFQISLNDLYFQNEEINNDNNENKVIEMIETTDNLLFVCYLLTNPIMLRPFLRSKNYCSLDIIESNCHKFNLIEPLNDYYYSINDYQKCINLLKNNEDIQENKKLISFLHKLLYLNNPPLDLILETIGNDTNIFHQIFENESIDYSNIDITQIIKFLKNNKMDCTNYLEFVVFNLNIQSNNLINELFDIYFDDIILNFNKIENLLKLGLYNAHNILNKLKRIDYKENNDLRLIIKKLMILPLMKIGKYDDIIEIYINDLNDIKSSIEFCIDLRNTKNDSLSKGLVFKILDLCLKNKNEEGIIDYILNNSELDFINFEEILIKLPSNISIKLMSSFLVMNLKKLNSENKNLIIKNELLKINTINMNLNKSILEKKMVKLTSTSICLKCGKLFNKSEILCFLPNGNILHYNCSKN